MTTLIKDFTYVNASGEQVLQKNFLDDWCSSNPGVFELERYYWFVDTKKIWAFAKDGYRCLLPDLTGFIVFEHGYKSNGCLITDVYNRELMRLNVPLDLIEQNFPKDTKMWFCNISKPYINPETGIEGKFGVTAYIEHAGDYYFELDWKTGKFLWGKEIRF